MNNLEWLTGYEAFSAFASWARRHNFCVGLVDRIEEAFRHLQRG